MEERKLYTLLKSFSESMQRLDTLDTKDDMSSLTYHENTAFDKDEMQSRIGDLLVRYDDMLNQCDFTLEKSN